MDFPRIFRFVLSDFPWIFLRFSKDFLGFSWDFPAYLGWLVLFKTALSAQFLVPGSVPKLPAKGFSTRDGLRKCLRD